MSEHLAAFARATVRVRRPLEHHGLETRVGRWLDSDVLKLIKPRWLAPAAQGCGISLSLWIDADALRLGRLNYNIHALKLRDLPGHRLQSREFAAAFRAAFKASHSPSTWPNLSLDHGPQTLLQGWIKLVPARLELDAAALIERLASLAPLIDTLLAERATLPRLT
jgi:hypothetical protein